MPAQRSHALSSSSSLAALCSAPSSALRARSFAFLSLLLRYSTPCARPSLSSASASTRSFEGGFAPGGAPRPPPVGPPAGVPPPDAGPPPAGVAPVTPASPAASSPPFFFLAAAGTARSAPASAAHTAARDRSAPREKSRQRT